MPFFAIVLLLISAVIHTTWNLLLKQAGEKYLVSWWAGVIGCLIFLPVLFFTGLPARSVWLILLISAIFEVAYYIVLATGYKDADFSLIYPMGRGAAPALIAVGAVVFLHEQLTAGGVLGIVIIIAGLLMIGASSLAQAHSRPHVRGILLALLLALTISIYSTLDGVAVRQTAALPYVVVIFFCAPVFTSPLVFQRYGWDRMQEELKAHAWRLSAIGVLTICAYSLALWAYSLSPLGYAGAVREVSVVMAAFAGWQFLGERLGGLRVLGAIVIFAGILVIALFG
jgi:drug/metabolite transporter (DMT)-like permease